MKWLKVEPTTAYMLVSLALVLGAPFFVVAGWLSDRWGRKRVIICGFIVGVLTVIPIFKGLTHFANPALDRAIAAAPVTLASSECRLRMFSAPGNACERAREQLNTARSEERRVGEEGFGTCRSRWAP